MSAKALWIYGGGAHARKVCHTARAAGWLVRGFIDEAVNAHSPVEGLPLLHPGALPSSVPDGSVFVAIGRPDVRRRLVYRLTGDRWTIATVVHPLAWVAPDACVAAGVLVAAGAIVESGAEIGRGAILDIGVLVDHDCRVGEFCHLRPGRVLQPSTVVETRSDGGSSTPGGGRSHA